MPVRLSELVNDSKIVTVAIGEHSINIRYRPNTITMPALLRLETINSATLAQQMEIMAELLAEFIGDWDILGEDDTPVPVTVDTIKAMPYRLIELIMQAIKDDTEAATLEKKALSANSAAGSQQKENSVNVPNGTASSARQGSFT